MMKTTYLIFLFILLSASSYSQNVFPEGVYLTVEQLKNKTPAFNAPLDIYLKNDEYHILSKIDSLGYNYFHRNVIAISKNDSLYLNPTALHPHLHGEYSLAIVSGVYMIFTGKMRQVEVNKYSKNGFIINNIVGYRTGPVSFYIAIGWLSKKKPYAYVLSLNSGNTKLLTHDYFKARLKENQPLLDEYNNESKESKKDLYFKYFKRINERQETK